MPNIRSAYTDSVSFFGKNSPHQLAERFGTPLYIYNESILRQRCQQLRALSSHASFCVNYSAKANTNLHLLSIIRQEGCIVDAMSPGELHLNQLAGFIPEEILYVCNNVSADELRNAVNNKVLVSVDSLSQLDLYGSINPGGDVMVRFNPGIGAGHHQKVITAGKATKFGVSTDNGPEDMDAVFALLHKHRLRLAGINQHIGSLFMEPEGYLNAVDVLLDLAERLPAEALKNLDIIDFGGGFGIPYHKYEGEAPLDLAALGSQLHARISAWTERSGYKGRFFVEPGRFVVAECGLLLGTVNATKSNNGTRYVGTDLGFTTLMRPALYDSFHDLEIYREKGSPDSHSEAQTVVGNICESGDILAKDRVLPLVQEGDLLAVLDAGAYGYVMASTYNQRLRPAEILIGLDGEARCIRRRESFDDLLAGYEGL